MQSDVVINRSYRFRLCGLAKARKSQSKRRSISKTIRLCVEIEDEMIPPDAAVISTLAVLSFLERTVKDEGGVF
jgi:hypothetical protein